jgi:DNA polymerase V
MMETLSEFAPDIEVYSIDECFLGMTGFSHFNLSDFGQTIRKTVKQHIGIPCCVGMGPTKTLAKIANRLAKKVSTNNGVFVINDELTRNHALRNIAIDDIWGIGRQYHNKLAAFGLKTAYDLARMAPEWGRMNLGA